MANRSIQSYLYEGAVIVASILIAFALDAAWADYQEKRAEERLLRELRAEFSLAESRIIGSIDELENALSATDELLSHIGPNTPTMSVSTSEDLLTRLWAINTLEVPSSTLNSIISGGQLGLIDNDDLRSSLTEWPALVADVRENHEWHREEMDDFLIPAISAFIPMRDSAHRIYPDCCGESGFQFDSTDLQRDPVFEGRLVNRVTRQRATLRESNALLDATRDVIEIIDNELQH